MIRGSLIISIDTELLWGRHDLNYSNFLRRAKKERSIIKKLLSLFTKYHIPATWGVVGHLFLKQCSPKNNINHPEINRPNYPWVKGDWFKDDPATSIRKDPAWYGQDLVKLIKDTPHQEIACHSFSHVLFGHPGCSRDCAESEITTCLKLAKGLGIKFQSFIFPRNSVGHLNLLKKYGFSAFRSLKPAWQNHNNLLTKLVQLAWLVSPLAPPVFEAKKVSGLVDLPGSMYYLSTRGPRKLLPIKLRVLKAKLGINQAIKQKKIFHLWFHPTDLVDDPKLLAGLEEVIVFATSLRQANQLSIMTMGEFAKLLK